MRTSVTQLTPNEIDELLEICQAAGAFDFSGIVLADEDDDDDDHGDKVSYHPEYGMYLYAADPGAMRKEHLHFKVAVESMDREVDYYHYEIRVGEVIDYMGDNVANLQVIKWFIDHGFQVWPQSIEDAALAARASGPELQKALEDVREAMSRNPGLQRDMAYLSELGEQALERNAQLPPADNPLRHLPAVPSSITPHKPYIHVTEALEKIRGAGRNEDPTAQWMQKWAAHALDPDLPRPPDEPPLKIGKIMQEIPMVPASRAYEAEAELERYKQWADDEIYDETDPRWWRGNDTGVEGACMRFEEALDGKYDEDDPHFGLQRLSDLVKRVRDLRKWVNDLQTKLYINCVYCGHRYGPGDEQVPAEALAEHIKTCPEHPLSRALAGLKGALDTLGKIHSVCHDNLTLEQGDLAYQLANIAEGALQNIDETGVNP